MSEVETEIASGGGPAGLAQRFEKIEWYHTQDLGNGLVTPGMFDHRPYVDYYGLPEDMSGMRVLDVGTFEGFWAFEFERRGATVTALDVDNVGDLDWPPHLRPPAAEQEEQRGEGFRLASEAFGSSVERVGCPIYEATPERLGGQFDLVFCGSVLIHLRDPMLALERMASLCSDRLIIADEYSRKLEWVPKLRLAEFRGMTPWMLWWRPNSKTWIEMIRCAGFHDVKRIKRFNMRFRDQRGGVPHVVLHARKRPVQS